MNITQELNNINVPNPTKEFIQFKSDSIFIDHTLEILKSDNISQKKNFFLDNQNRIMDSINNMKKLLICISDQESNLYKIVAITIKKLEDRLNKFKLELKVSAANIENDNIILDEDTIQDAIVNNSYTKKMIQDLESGNEYEADEKTLELKEKLLQTNSTPKHIKPLTNPQCVQYMVTSQDLSEIKVIPGTNLPKQYINRFIENCGIDNARVFELVEVPTTQKVIKKIVTTVI